MKVDLPDSPVPASTNEKNSLYRLQQTYPKATLALAKASILSGESTSATRVKPYCVNTDYIIKWKSWSLPCNSIIISILMRDFLCFFLGTTTWGERGYLSSSPSSTVPHWKHEVSCWASDRRAQSIRLSGISERLAPSRRFERTRSRVTLSTASSRLFAFRRRCARMRAHHYLGN